MNRMNFEEQINKELHTIRYTNKPIILVGASILGKIALKVLKIYDKLPVCFADNNSIIQGKRVENIQIYSVEDAVERYKEGVFVLCIAIRKNIAKALLQITKQIQELDFVGHIISPYTVLYASQIEVLEREINTSKFVKALYSLSMEKDVFPHFDVCVTSRCSLNCKHCSVLIPYRKPGINADKYEIVHATRKIFSVINGVRWVQLFGGEPFLYKDLLYVAEEISKIDNAIMISIVTNGTILPSEEFLTKLANYVSVIFISDYGELSNKLKDLVTLCNKVGVVTSITDYSKQNWRDMGNFERRNYTKRQITDIYSACVKNECLYKITPDCKFILCERQLIPALDNAEQIIDLNNDNISIEELRDKLYKILALPYIEACNYCKSLEMISVPPAIQVAGKLEF